MIIKAGKNIIENVYHSNHIHLHQVRRSRNIQFRLQLPNNLRSHRRVTCFHMCRRLQSGKKE